MAEYQNSVSSEIEARLKAKCEKLADAFIDDIGSLISIYLITHYFGIYEYNNFSCLHIIREFASDLFINVSD